MGRLDLLDRDSREGEEVYHLLVNNIVSSLTQAWLERLGRYHERRVD